MLSQLENHVLRPIKNRIANALARAVVNLVNDGTKMQEVQIGVLADETRDAERFQNYGFSSVPLPGAEAAAICPNGDRGHVIVVAIDDRRYRPRGGQPGEVVMYTDEGDQIRLGRGHVISIGTSGEVRLGSAAASSAVTLATEIAALKALIALIPAGGPSDPVRNAFSAWSAPGATKVKAE